MALSTKQVNKAIAHTGLTVEKIDNSYFIFVDAEGNDFGSVMVASLSHLSRAQWIEEAESAKAKVEQITARIAVESPAEANEEVETVVEGEEQSLADIFEEVEDSLTAAAAEVEAIKKEEAEAKEEADNELFAISYDANGGNEKRGRGKGLRGAARTFRFNDKSRKEFLASAVAFGISAGSASDAWHFSKTRAD